MDGFAVKICVNDNNNHNKGLRVTLLVFIEMEGATREREGKR